MFKMLMDWLGALGWLGAVPQPTPLLAAAAEAGSEEGSAIVSLIDQLPFSLLMTIAATAFLATLVVSKFARRLQVPAVLGVLLLGAAISPQQNLIGPIVVENIHIVSLTMLLFYAGLKTNLKNIRNFLGYGLLLAIGGVVVSSMSFGLIIYAVYQLMGSQLAAAGFFSLPLSVSMMMAACLSSTDVGVTLSVLSPVSRYVPERVRGLLEFESSVNDPASILFLLLVIGINIPAPDVTSAIKDLAVTGLAGQVQFFIKSIGSGILVGLILTYVGEFILRNFVSSKDQILIVGISIAFASYGLSCLLGGSGFISAYVTGLFLANNIYNNPTITQDVIENSIESFNTLMEMTVFLLFGLVVNPSNALLVLPEAVICGLALMFVARPLSVLLFSRVSPFNWRESILISWCGLRGAVPLALCYTLIHTTPELPGIPPTMVTSINAEIEGFVFVVVVFNLALQGLTLPIVSRRLGLQGESA